MFIKYLKFIKCFYYIDLTSYILQIYVHSVPLWTSGSNGLDLDRYVHECNGLV